MYIHIYWGEIAGCRGTKDDGLVVDDEVEFDVVRLAQLFRNQRQHLRQFSI